MHALTRAARSADHDHHAEQPRGAPARDRRRRGRRRRTSPSARGASSPSGCEYVLVTGTHENTPQVVNTLYGQDGVVRADTLAAPARLLSRLRLHARLRHRRDHRQRPGDRRRGEGRAGIHVADAEGGVPARHGPAHSRPPVLGARGRARRTKAARSPERGSVVMSIADSTPSRPTWPIPPRCSARSKRRSPAARGWCSTATRSPTPALRLEQARALAALCRAPRRAAHHQRSSRPRARGRCRRPAHRRRGRLGRRGARAARPGQDPRRLLLPADRERARSRARQGATYVAFGGFFPSSVKPRLGRRAARDPGRSEAPARRCPWWRSAASPWTMRPALDRRRRRQRAVITALFDAPDVRAAAQQFSALFAR